MKLITRAKSQHQNKQDGRRSASNLRLHKGFNQLRIKKYLKKIPGQSKTTLECSMGQQLSALQLQVLIQMCMYQGIIGNLKMIYSIQEDVYKLYENTIPFIQGNLSVCVILVSMGGGGGTPGTNPRDTKVQPQLRMEVWRTRERRSQGEMGRQAVGRQPRDVPGWRVQSSTLEARSFLPALSYILFLPSNPPVSLQQLNGLYRTPYLCEGGVL